VNGLRVGLVLGAVVAALGCGATVKDMDWVQRRSLEQSQQRYTQLVRWGEIDRASQFVDPALREDFLSHRDAFESIRITEFEVGRIVPGDDPDTASVEVTYHGYSQRSFVARPLRESQLWYWSDEAGAWLVRPRLGELIDGVAGRSP